MIDLPYLGDRRFSSLFELPPDVYVDRAETVHPASNRLAASRTQVVPPRRGKNDIGAGVSPGASR
jgi:hypothetical protein